MTFPNRPQNTRGPERWVTKAEIARHLQRSTRWVELRHSQGLPSVQLSPRGPRRYLVSEVDNWLREVGSGG